MENAGAEERLASLESTCSDLKAFQQEAGENIKQILTLLSARKDTSTLPPATPKAWNSSSNNKELGWKVTVDLLTNELESRKVALADIDHLREELEGTTQEKSELEDRIIEIEKEREQYKHEKELLQQRLVQLGDKSMEKKENALSEFPSNETILHNLLVAQIEFYFSNHHLKRDKPLMEKLCDEPDVGFVSLEVVTDFPKVRTLGQSNEVIEKAVKSSRHLMIREKEPGKLLIGRENFQPPKAQEFPFRRTVFVYGIPPNKEKEKWVREQFECFGNIAKVKFDNGQHTLPRKVGARLLTKEKTRVVRLHMRDEHHTEFKFQMKSGPGHDSQIPSYYCHECGKMKNYKDGYYVSDNRTQQGNVFCVQCAAKRAESNLKYFQKRCHNHYMDTNDLKKLFGIDLKEYSDTENLQSFRTCLVVFESQRQASKCVYVRSRLGIEGCFATHFHNYTRHKREISQGIELPEPSMAKQDSQFRLQPRPAMAPQRSMGARIEKTYSKMPGLGGLMPPKMRKHQSTPTLGKHSAWKRRNTHDTRI